MKPIRQAAAIVLLLAVAGCGSDAERADPATSPSGESVAAYCADLAALREQLLMGVPLTPQSTVAAAVAWRDSVSEALATVEAGAAARGSGTADAIGTAWDTADGIVTGLPGETIAGEYEALGEAARATRYEVEAQLRELACTS